MTPATLLSELTARGVEFQANEDILRFRPKDRVTPEEVVLILQHRVSLLEILRRERTEAAPIINRVLVKCDRCGSTDYRDVPIHFGQSKRRDCGRCGRFLGWPLWYGRANKEGDLHAAPFEFSTRDVRDLTNLRDETALIGGQKLHHGDCLAIMPKLGRFDCIFADPPDNIGLKYNECDDSLPVPQYLELIEAWFVESSRHAPIMWFSFNSRWMVQFGAIVWNFLCRNGGWACKPCVQVFTFGQHNQHWLGNNHRPLWCIFQKDATFYPDQVRIPSWRQRNGDKRADPRGRVPGDVFDMQYPHPGDVFDFPRVTGNSKERCDWHPTQLHEELVERVIRFSTPEGGCVLDPFAGTGTTLRVCKRIGRNATGIEIDANYYERVRAGLRNGPISSSPI